jgi:hypothetical protein
MVSRLANMADLSYDELREIERPDRPPVKVIQAKTLEDIETYLNTLPKKNVTRQYQVEVVEGHQLNFSEEQLNELVRSNRHYKKILDAYGTVKIDVPVKTIATEPKINTKLLTSTSYAEATQKSGDVLPPGQPGVFFPIKFSHI